MFIDKDTISSIEMMTEEERQDPSLVRNTTEPNMYYTTLLKINMVSIEIM